MMRLVFVEIGGHLILLDTSSYFGCAEAFFLGLDVAVGDECGNSRS